MPLHTFFGKYYEFIHLSRPNDKLQVEIWFMYVHMSKSFYETITSWFYSSALFCERQLTSLQLLENAVSITFSVPCKFYNKYIKNNNKMAKLSQEILEKIISTKKETWNEKRWKILRLLYLGNECIYSHQHSYLQLDGLLSGWITIDRIKGIYERNFSLNSLKSQLKDIVSVSHAHFIK